MSFKKLTRGDIEVIERSLIEGMVFRAGGIFNAMSRDITYLFKFQGYDTSLCFIEGFFTPRERETDEHYPKYNEYEGDILITPSKRCRVESPLLKLEQTSDGLLSRNVVITREKPLELLIHASSNHLSEPPTQGYLANQIYAGGDWTSQDQTMDPHHPYKPTQAEIDLLRGIGIAQFGGFSVDKMVGILEWIKGNMTFDLNQFKPGEIIPTGKLIAVRRGVCNEYANLFAHLIYAMGGISRTRLGKVVNLDIEGSKAFPVSFGDDATHVWNEIYYGDRWHVVDPTLYRYHGYTAIDGLKNIYQLSVDYIEVILLGAPLSPKDEIKRALKKDTDLRVKAESMVDLETVKNTE